MLVQKPSEADVSKAKFGYRRTRHAKPCKDMRYVCQVCGDVAFGYNFNAITCESCKSFFRRQAQIPEVQLTCPNVSDCKITKETRKHCPACRMQKCAAVGMSKLRVSAGVDKRRASDTNSDDSSSAAVDTEQLAHLPLKERYKAARKILDGMELETSAAPSVTLSKTHAQLAETVAQCGSKMVAPFSVPDAGGSVYEPDSLERQIYAQHIERRFVTSLKACPDFAAFTDKEQLDILKRGMLNYHNLVSAFYVDVNANGSGNGGWRVPLVDREPLWIAKEVIYGRFERTPMCGEIQSFFDAYVRFAASVRRRFGPHWTAVQFTLTLVQLFSPFCLSAPATLVLYGDSADGVSLSRCLPLHYKYVNFLQAYCDWLDESTRPSQSQSQTRQDNESSWSFCMAKLVELHAINRKFAQALNLIASNSNF